ncbi:hypothetical protein SESBI_28304 [Sesbania bispinosa]|nr:hypothetical protein SESBI_28304 [Sesbania bispinosa]
MVATSTLVKESKGKEKIDSPRTRSSPRTTHPFLNKEVEKLYNTKFKKRKVLLGRLSNLENLRRSNWNLMPYVQKQDLGDFFEKDIEVYPSLTRAFHGAASVEWNGQRTPRIRSWLKGQQMIPNIELISKLTRLKAKGIFLYN